MKLHEIISGASHVKGRVRPCRVIPGAQAKGIINLAEIIDGNVWRRTGPWCKNDILYSWGAATARVLTSISAQNYRISGMYMEYQNVGNPADMVTVPGFDRTGGNSYYDALSSSPNTDFLRVPMVTTSLDNSNPNLFSDVNRMTFFAMSQGVIGVNGKPFSDTVNSKIYGGALVAIVDLGDYTQDVIFSRFYLPTNKQQVKLATSMVGLEWEIALV